MRANAQGRIIGNKHRKGLGTSRGPLVKNGRRPCEPSSAKASGYEEERLETDRTGPGDVKTWNVMREKKKKTRRNVADDSGSGRHSAFSSTSGYRKSSQCEGFGVLIIVYSFIPVKTILYSIPALFTQHQEELINHCANSCSYLLV